MMKNYLCRVKWIKPIKCNMKYPIYYSEMDKPTDDHIEVKAQVEPSRRHHLADPGNIQKEARQDWIIGTAVRIEDITREISKRWIAKIQAGHIDQIHYFPRPCNNTKTV